MFDNCVTVNLKITIDEVRSNTEEAVKERVLTSAEAKLLQEQCDKTSAQTLSRDLVRAAKTLRESIIRTNRRDCEHVDVNENAGALGALLDAQRDELGGITNMPIEKRVAELNKRRLRIKASKTYFTSCTNSN